MIDPWAELEELLRLAGVKPCLCFTCSHQPSFGPCSKCWCGNRRADDASREKLTRDLKATHDGDACPNKCRASRGDGECVWSECPQLRDHKPACPLACWQDHDE